MVFGMAAATDTSSVLSPERGKRRKTYPAVGMAVGLAKYFSGFSKVEQAFHAIEDVHRAQGFPLPAAAAAHLDPGVLAAFAVWINPSLEVSCQVQRTMSGDDKLKLIGGLVSGHYTLPTHPGLSLFAGLGGGRYGFSFQRNYHAQITPSSGGGYNVLDSIVLEGAGPYWTGASGLALGHPPHGVFEMAIQYFGMRDVSTDTPGAGRVSAQVSGTTIAATYTLFYR